MLSLLCEGAMKLTRIMCICALGLLFSATARPQASSEPSLPYSPSLNLESIDKSIDPCVNLYQYACGRWQKQNPIPADQTSWSVYGKLYADNLNFLHGILEQAAAPSGQRDAVNQKIGDYYAACIDETTIEKRGIEPIQGDLERIAALKTAHDLAPLLAYFHTTIGGRALLFAGGSDQDPDNSEQVIASLAQGGLGLAQPRLLHERRCEIERDARAIRLRMCRRCSNCSGDNAEMRTSKTHSS